MENFSQKISGYARLPKIEKFRKSKKKIQKELESISGKQKTKKIASEKESILINLLRKKISGEKAIGEYLDEKGMKATSAEIKWLKTLVDLKFDLRPLSLWPNLFNKPIKYKTVSNFDIRNVTGDKLIARYYQGEAIKGVMERCCNVMRVGYYSNNLMTIEDEQKAFEYYVEDFSLYYTGPFYENNANTYVQSKDQLTIKGEKYNVAIGGNGMNKEDVIIFKETLEFQNVIEKLNNQVKIKSEKGLKKGIREYKYSPGNYYFNQEVILTDIFPPILVLPKIMNFTLLFDGEIDIEAYLEAIKSKEEEDININLLSIDNLEPIMNLIGVIGLIFDGKIFFKTDYTYQQVYEYYWENKIYFGPVKSLYNDFRTIVIFYMESFTVRVSIDRMKKVYDSCVSWLETWEQFLKSRANQITNKFLSYIFDTDNMFSNFINHSQQVISTLKYSSELCISPNSSDIDNLEKTLRASALIIQNCLIAGKNKMIPEYRSPFSFLGNTIGDPQYAQDVFKFAQDLIEIADKKKNEKEIKILEENKVKTLGVSEGKEEIYNVLLEQLNDKKTTSMSLLDTINKIGAALGKKEVIAPKILQEKIREENEKINKMELELSEQNKLNAELNSKMQQLTTNMQNMRQEVPVAKEYKIDTGLFGFYYNRELPAWESALQSTNKTIGKYTQLSVDELNAETGFLATVQIDVTANPGTKTNPVFCLTDAMWAIVFVLISTEGKVENWKRLLMETEDYIKKFKGTIQLDKVYGNYYADNLLKYMANNLNDNEKIFISVPNTSTPVYNYHFSRNPFYFNLNWGKIFFEVGLNPNTNQGGQFLAGMNKLYQEARGNNTNLIISQTGN